jgi:hypothetical protein
LAFVLRVLLKFILYDYDFLHAFRFYFSHYTLNCPMSYLISTSSSLIYSFITLGSKSGYFYFFPISWSLIRRKQYGFLFFKPL